MVNDFSDIVKIYNRNLLGWRTNRKIIVIESDDWGSIRMPSRSVYNRCLLNRYPVNLNPFERLDSLASKNDLEMLFELLLSIKDKNGNHPILTANCVVANPDFEKIEKDNFQKYHNELITETFKRYPNHSNNFSIWNKGKDENVFFPQFHAREHLNVSKFMHALQNKDPDVHFGFKHHMPGCIRKGNMRNANYFVEATRFNSEQDKQDKLQIYLQGLDIFQQLFGYKSKSIIPTNYIWSNDYNELVSEKGVKYIQGSRKLREPSMNNKTIYTSRFLGKRNTSGQIALVRNVTFEPSLTNYDSAVDRCFSEINIAFKMKKPAIISMHRINFVGHISIQNRDRNLKLLNDLLTRVQKKWPEIEFMHSVELGDFIENCK